MKTPFAVVPRDFPAFVFIIISFQICVPDIYREHKSEKNVIILVLIVFFIKIAIM